MALNALHTAVDGGKQLTLELEGLPRGSQGMLSLSVSAKKVEEVVSEVRPTETCERNGESLAKQDNCNANGHSWDAFGHQKLDIHPTMGASAFKSGDETFASDFCSERVQAIWPITDAIIAKRLSSHFHGHSYSPGQQLLPFRLIRLDVTWPNVAVWKSGPMS